MRVAIILFFWTLTSLASDGEPWWRDILEDEIPQRTQRTLQPDVYRTLRADLGQLTQTLDAAPDEGLISQVVLSLPLPEGGQADFLLEASPVMAPELAARYPEIRTFLGRGLSNRTETLRCDITPAGFHAAVLGSRGTWRIDPYQAHDQIHLISYYKRHYPRPSGEDFICDAARFDIPQDFPFSSRTSIEGELLVYRAAIACTGEYAAFHGGSVPQALAAVVTTLNRVNGIYERDAALRMVLVPNNDAILFTDALSDPYTNNNGFAMLNENQVTLDAIIGSANYDIGHVFSTGGGGVALVGSPCTPGLKAQGVTGLAQPVGDPFDVDYVAHEMGHQWGSPHTFNGTTSFCGGNRSAATAYEPGSGSTILSYAGICGAENLQDHSDDYFHGASLDRIIAFTRNSPGNCGTMNPVANQAPMADAGPDYAIPHQTPFTLTATAADPDSDAMTWCWEQFDLGPASPPNTDDGSRPIFRSFPPEDQGSRTFPQISDILNQTQTIGESPILTTRQLHFRVTVRDNHAGGGGVDSDEMVIQSTTEAGPFQILTPNTAVTWTGGDLEEITWDPSQTHLPPVSCEQVDILLSIDGGFTYPITIQSNTPNSGSALVEVPNLDVPAARLKIACSNNIFFDLSDSQFTIASVPLICTTAWANWLKPSAGIFEDNNSNGLVDVADYIHCQFQ